MSEPYRPVGPQAVTARVAAIVLAVAARTHPSMTEVARRGLLVSTTHRLLSGLVAGRLVERTVQGRYQLDPAALPTWSGPVALRAHIIRRSRGSRGHHGAARSVRRCGDEQVVSCLGWSGGHGRKDALTRSEVLPAHATAAGKALLAFAPETEVHRILARRLPAHTGHTITTSEALREALATVPLRGVAVAHGSGVPTSGRSRHPSSGRPASSWHLR